MLTAARLCLVTHFRASSVCAAVERRVRVYLGLKYKCNHFKKTCRSRPLPAAPDDPADHVRAVRVGPNESRHDRVLLVWYEIQGRNPISQMYYLFRLHRSTFLKHSDTCSKCLQACYLPWVILGFNYIIGGS